MAKTTCSAVGFGLEVSVHRTPVESTGLYEPSVSVPSQLVTPSPSAASFPGTEGQGEREKETMGKNAVFSIPVPEMASKLHLGVWAQAWLLPEKRK